jgi:hypothetical protein
MIQVTLGTNTNRKKVTVDPNTQIKTVLNDNEINYEVATLHMDGATLQPGDLNRTFTDFGVSESCYLIAVVKADNAA